MKKGIRALAVLAVCAVAIPAWAESIAPEFSLSIPRQSLKSSLIEFSRQTGLVVSYLSKSDETEEQLVGPLNGRYTIESALNQILKDSALVFTRVGEARIAITARGSSVSAGQLTDPERDVTHEAKPRVHQLGGAGELATQTERRRIRAANGDVPAARDAESHEIEFNLPEVLVTGSRILNQDIKRSRDDIQPYVVYDRKKVEQSGARNVEEFLKQRLPMVTTQGAPNQVGSDFGNVSLIALRGLGASETLILIDGHRVAGYGFNGNAQQPDLNAIPAGAVDRIEVLPTSASAIYGGSATGGVINVVLRRDYSGVETKLTYGNTFENDASERRVDISAGLNFDEGRTNVLFFGSYADSSALLVGERDFARRARERVLANNPGAFLNSAPPVGSTTNISSAFTFDFATFTFSRPPLTLKDGTPLNANSTFVPVGYAGVASDGGAALVANAGLFNLDLANTAQTAGARRSLLNNPTIESAGLTLRREFSEKVSAYLDAAITNNFGHYTVNNTGTLVIPASSPSNPFAQAVEVAVPTFGADDEIVSTLRGRRIIGGVGVGLPGDWQLAGHYTWDRTRFSSSSPSGFATDPQSVPTLASVAVSNGTIDVFRDMNANPPDFSSYLATPARILPVDTTLQALAVQVGGPTFTLPGGPVVLSGRIEGRKEALDEFVGTNPTFNSNTIFPSRSLSNRAVYMETRLPVVSARNALTGAAEFELQFAGRYDEYEIIGANSYSSLSPQPVSRSRNEFSSIDPMVGLKYAPIRGLALRASYSTGFLPPSMQTLVPSPPTFLSAANAAFIGLRDPRRGNEPLGNTMIFGGGNPNLDPEESETLAVGVILQPQAVDGLRLSLDWTRMEKTDVVTSFSVSQATILTEPYIPELVVRGPAAAGDPFGVGPIVEIHSQPFNIARRDVDSYDLSLDYSLSTMRFGSFAFAASSSWLAKNESQVVEISPVVDDLGFVGGMKFKGNATLLWEFGQWTAAWTARYFHSYKVGSGIFTSPTTIQNQGSPRIPSQIYHDLVASYRFDSSGGFAGNLLSGVDVQLGIKNVFNKEPPLDLQSFGFDSALYSLWGDPRLASYYLSLRKAF